ncbi:ribosomal protection-like ABC-F family protein [Furfurilactobacillus siliginis]|nr:ABC-F family ATP-binding cassette domain-containing protein [Furfurilactobacillus siliginis]KRN95986.1 ABC superfamily ATP binding cassette transporter, ABC protein [Furfurilactobacillus siliginis]
MQAHDLSITRQAQSLFTIDQLVINAGDRIGLIGANGVGKTTLIDLLTGKLMPDTGTIDVSVQPTFVAQLHDVSTQSGGEQVKAAILAALREQPEWLILDEPSANLDIDNQAWLIQQLQRFNGTLLLIAHDRHLLNAVTDTTWELADQQLTTFAGNYDAFMIAKDAQQSHQQAAYQVYQQQKRKLADAARKRTERANRIAKPNPNKHSNNELKDIKMQLKNNQGKMTKAARVMNERADNLTAVAKPKTQAPMTLRAEQFVSLGRHTPIRVDHLKLSAGAKALSGDVTFTINANERVAITGPNQVGKTTLLRVLLANDAAAIHINSQVRFGYFDQNMQHLDLNKTIWDTVNETSQQEESTLRTILAEFGFTATMLPHPAQALSGGQRVKLALVQVLVSEANVLILDEPTNYLDLPTMTALEQFLSTYPGTVLFVSHDQEFVKHVATRTLTLSKNGLHDLTQTKTTHKTSEERAAADEALLNMFRA